MRSPRESVLLAALLLGAAATATAATPNERPPLDPVPIERAIDELLADPQLNRQEKQRYRRFKQTDEPRQAEEQRDDALFGFLRWLADSTRVLMWIAGIVLALIAAWLLPRWWRLQGDARAAALAALPTHVMALDIRPDSLPDDVGAAAAALWRHGEQRAALSLLYRGLLSRLVHVHQVPIRAASTEGECVALARPRLAAPAADYAARLVAVWQRAVYAGQAPADSELLALCEQFAPQLAGHAVASAETAR